MPEFPRWRKRIDGVSADAGTQIQSLAPYSGLRNWCCHSCGVGCHSSSDSIPVPENSICGRIAKKEKKKISVPYQINEKYYQNLEKVLNPSPKSGQNNT